MLLELAHRRLGLMSRSVLEVLLEVGKVVQAQALRRLSTGDELQVILVVYIRSHLDGRRLRRGAKRNITREHCEMPCMRQRAR